MTFGRIGCELAVVAVLCILTIFFCPSIQGPYSAVNGPVTALQAARSATRLRTLIVQAAVRSLGSLLAPPLSLSFLSLPQSEVYANISADCSAVLRC